VRRLLASVVLLGCGCSSFVKPTADDLRRLHLAAPRTTSETVRYRLHLSVDSVWLAGEFEGVVLVDEGASPSARAQFFGDLGPKVFDLLARPDRIAGYFPQTREGVDCALPREAAPHPLLFLGVNLLEDFADVGEDRVQGIRQEAGGCRLDLKPLVPGMHSEVLRSPDGRTIERRFRWMYGLQWEERWESPTSCEITSTGLRLHVRIRSREPLRPPPARAYELALPDDVRVVEGSRK
jgi:hypothetical protein